MKCNLKLKKNMGQITYNYLNKYLIEVRAQGRYAFTVDELKNKFNLSPNALNQILYRLKQKKEIAQIRQGFYVVIPPEYSKQGMLPPYMFIDDLMKSLGKPYYVGLLSAAALYGAAHQQPMGYTVITQSPAPRSIDKLKIIFFARKDFLADGIIQKKTPAGYINVSSPELTALEFFEFIHKFGINRITTVLQELSEEMKPAPLLKIAKQYPNTAAIQRLGYVLDTVILEEKLSDTLLKVLSERNCFPVPLSPQKEKKGETDTKWKIIKNMEIESDL
jgi:predicted transcriptional regulator of viral defense system